MQLDTTTIGVVGTVSHMTSGEGEPGNDWALVRIDPAVAAEWGVDPAIPSSAARRASTRAARPTAVAHYGHGYGVAVVAGQAGGRPRHEPRTTTATAGRASARRATPAARRGHEPERPAVGDFTHLIVDLGAYPGSDSRRHADHEGHAPVRGVSLVNADGSTTGAAATSCGNAPN